MLVDAMRIRALAVVGIGLLASCGSSEEDSAGGSGATAGGGASAGSAGVGGGTGGNAASTSGGAAGNAGASASGGGGLAGSAGAGGTAGASGGSAGAAGSGGAGGSEMTFDPLPVAESKAAFPVGIQAGDPTQNAVVLWTKHAGSAPLVLRVYTPTTPGKALVFFDSVVTPDAQGYVHVDAGGLPSLTELSYVFLEQQGPTGYAARSPIGRCVTAPAAGAKVKLRFGGTSCTKNDRAPFDALTRAGEQKLDFFILAGDTTYNDSATTLADYRGKWLGQIGEGTYQHALQSTAHYATWDDHEVDNDWNPETFPAARFAAARQAFFEHLAIRRDSVTPDRVWRKFSWGDTLEVFVLDARSERKPSTAAGPNAEYLSPAQLSWLTAGLKSSTAVFKIIVNSVPITNFPGLFDFAAMDRWEGYSAQRTKLLDFLIQNKIPGVLFVSGDFHLGASARVEPSGPWSPFREVLVGPGDYNGNPLWVSLPGPPHFDFKTGTSNVTIFEADPNAVPPTISMKFIASDGATLHTQTLTY